MKIFHVRVGLQTLPAVTAMGPASAARKAWRYCERTGAWLPKGVAVASAGSGTRCFLFTSTYSDGSPRPVSWAQYACRLRLRGTLPLGPLR